MRAISIFGSRVGPGFGLGLLVLFVATASLLVAGGDAWAGPASRPGRATAAPANVLTLTDYAMQPPGGDVPEPGEGEERDTFNLEPQPPPPGTFRADTTGRADSLFSIPKPPPAGSEDSLANRIIPPVVAAPPTTTSSPAVRHRRGVLGIHPAALLIGLVALHIFVVTVVAK